MVTWGSRGDQAALGPAFDVRDFHHALLKGGTLPLHMLRDQVWPFSPSFFLPFFHSFFFPF